MVTEPAGAGLGTIERWHHVLVQNAGYYSGGGGGSGGGGPVTLGDRLAIMLGRTFAESTEQRPNVTVGLFREFVEANILAQRLRYPAAVKFVVADFDAHFGSAVGASVRQWCQQWGWPLLWSLPSDKCSSGGGGGGGCPPVRASVRLVDLAVAKDSALNLTMPQKAAALFEKQWAAAVAQRAATPRNTLSIAACNVSDTLQLWAGAPLREPTANSTGPLLNQGASCQHGDKDKGNKQCGWVDSGSLGHGVCVSSRMGQPASSHHHGGGFFQIGPPCERSFHWSLDNHTIIQQDRTGGGATFCLDVNNGVGPVELYPCHPAGDPDIGHQQFDYDTTTGLLHTMGDYCVTLVPPPGPAPIDAASLWSQLETGLPPAAFVRPVSPHGCADVDRCVGMVDNASATFGDCVCVKQL
eukprot:SAG31_NODE_5393_length_2565_cov_1.959043_1_plen_411_part_00